MTTVGARVREELVLLVEVLREIQGPLRAEAVESIGVALQLRQVIEQGRRQPPRLAFDGRDVSLSRLGPLDDLAGFLAVGRQPRATLGWALVEKLSFADRRWVLSRPEVCSLERQLLRAAIRLLSWLVAGTLQGLEGRDDLQIVLGHERANRQLPLDHHGQGRCLYPSD